MSRVQVPSRLMSRSVWKTALNEISCRNIRTLKVTPTLLHNSIEFSVHNGNKYRNIKISDKLLGFKLGEFFFTKSIAKFKNKKS